MSLFDHAALCTFAVAWLRRPASKGGPGCHFAVSETNVGATAETPDAIGMRYGETILVEAKLSRADFFADAAKPHRAPGAGMGLYRYFIAPEGLIKLSDLPTRWGLLEVSARKAIMVRAGHTLVEIDWAGVGAEEGAARKMALLAEWEHERNLRAEVAFLSRLLARVGDVEGMNRRIKETNRVSASNMAALERLRAENQRLCADYWAMRAQFDAAGLQRQLPPSQLAGTTS